MDAGEDGSGTGAGGSDDGSAGFRAASGDRALAVRLASRDPEALAEVYGLLGPLVLGVARRVVRDEVLAEDVVQEVFTYLWEHPDRYDPARGTMKAWVGLLAHRRAVDKVRAESRRARTEVYAGSRGGQTTDADPMVELYLDQEWVCARVRRAIDSLPPDQREALVRAYFGGRTYREVAAELTIPEGTAKSRIRLALARLHEVLRADLSDEGGPAWS